MLKHASESSGTFFSACAARSPSALACKPKSHKSMANCGAGEPRQLQGLSLCVQGNRSQLTKHMAVNLKDAERELLEKWDQGQLAETDVVCFPLDRGSNKAYVRQYTTNLAPTLTTSNKYLFVVSVGCLRKPEAERRFFRFLDSTERLTLQGFKKSVLSTSSEALRIKASGNAYPVPLLAAVLAPLLQQLAHPSARSHLDGRPQGNVQDADSAASRLKKPWKDWPQGRVALARLLQLPKDGASTRG